VVPLTLTTTSSGVEGDLAADHTYTNAGTYHVTVTAHNLITNETQTATDDVTVNARPFPYKQFASTNHDAAVAVTLRATDPDGDTSLTSSVFRQPAPSHLYAPGDYVAAVQLSDDQGHTNVGVVNAHVEELPPAVSAGSDLTARAGQAVTFHGSAGDYSGIATVEWDFNYDGGGQFTADPGAEGNLNPTHTFPEPGAYDVALRAVDRDGSANIDVITVTVTDGAPTGTVVLSPTKPDGSAQSLKEGSPVYFTVGGLSYADPSAPLSLWVNWGDGQQDPELVSPDRYGFVSHGTSRSSTTAAAPARCG
jgi:PKD repeat protein